MGGARRTPQPHASRPGEAVPLRDCRYSDPYFSTAYPAFTQAPMPPVTL